VALWPVRRLGLCGAGGPCRVDRLAGLVANLVLAARVAVGPSSRRRPMRVGPALRWCGPRGCHLITSAQKLYKNLIT
jgi:hypothetical protein